MRARQLAAILTALVLGSLLAPGAAEATGTLDQQQEDTSGGSSSVGSATSLAQTFTAGSSGGLDQVDLFLDRPSPATTSPLNVEIRSVDESGAPGATVLASATVLAESVPSPGDFVPVGFAAPAQVVAGTQYAIVLSTADPDLFAYEWAGSGADVYAAGSAWTGDPLLSIWVQDSQDLGFKTYTTEAPAIAIDDVTLSEGNSGSTTYAFTITRSGSLDGTSSVHLEASDDSASVADNDYAAASTDLAFDIGESTKTFDVTVNADTKFEPDEDFKVELSDAENATISDGEGIGTITNDDAQPTLSINDVAKSEGNSGTTAYGFTVSLSNPSYQQVTVSRQSANGSATTADSDYAALPAGTLSFSPGETSRQVTVNVNADTKFEPDEDFEVELSDAENATIADGEGIGTITNDDAEPTLSINDVAKSEGNSATTTTYTFTISRSGSLDGTSSVHLETSDDSASVADNDYAAASGDLAFDTGQSTKTFDVTVNADIKFEPDEDFKVELSDAENATISDGEGIGTITNDDGRPTITVNDVAKSEGNSGTTAYGFTVSLSNPSYQQVTVSRQSADGSATTADSDYAALAAGTLSFSPGETSRQVTVTVNADTKFEPDEDFKLQLSDAENATISDGEGIGTITNDDGRPTITVNDVAKTEGNSGTTAYGFTVSLSNPSYQQVTISGQSANGSATAADDYTALPISILTFSPGDTQKQVAVYAKGDTKFEPNENFFVNLSTAINAAIADGQGKGTITNDDGRPTITVNDVTKNEGNSGTTAYGFTVSLSNPSYQQITVSRQSANGSATTADSDYTALAAATLTFSPTQTQKQVTVNAKGDTKYEPTEDFQLNLSSATNAAIADGQGTGVIANDDPAPPPGYQPPYDPDFIVNRSIPAGFPSDPDNAAIVSRFVANLKSTKLLVSDHGEVPAVNIASLSDPVRAVSTGNVTTQFRIPATLKLGGGSDHPVEVLDPNPNPVTGRQFTELRIWHASWNGSTLSGTLGGLFHYNNDGAILNPDGSESLSNFYAGGGAGNGLAYLAGLVRPQEVAQGQINHTIRFAYSSADVNSRFRPPARKSDQTGSGAEMGTIFQLDPSVDCSARTAPGQLYDSLESRFVRIFCVALQRYGAMISDGTGSFRSANFYLEDDSTAHWANVIGSEAGTGNYGWLVRSKDVAYTSVAPPPTRDTDGIPWLRLRAIARPAGYTSW